ncbi:MAG: hypothetical protein HY735_06775 [Verrucomicrobia bacterium]|nr:hypothetical protein [Verrucomicrobiota bacterium]
MDDACAEIDASIVEVTKARQAVARGKSKQVYLADEIDRLKAVAYAWFQTHRPRVLPHPSRPDLQEVDAAYQTVLQATGRHAARSTYALALLRAKRSLVALRSLVAAMPATLSTQMASPAPLPNSDAPPSFAPLAPDLKMQEIMAQRWSEVQQCIGSHAHLAATVMMGGLLESLLLARINSSPNQRAVFTAANAPRDRTRRTLPLAEWKLVKMVEVAHELGWISRSAKDVGNVLRDFRNYIHPHKEYTDGVAISQDDACMFWEVTKAISRQVLTSVGKSP